jgi:N-acetylglutamate synthase-like GNAT family acetyltransferase
MTTDATTVFVNDRWVTIRPIRSTDSAMEAEFVRNLSAATKHTMAFVATVRDEGREVEIGVCRYASGRKSDAREMAVTISDEWQHTELAKLLMDHLLIAAKRYGIRQLYAIELADNQTMRIFAKDVGMTVERDPSDATQVIYSLGL